MKMMNILLENKITRSMSMLYLICEINKRKLAIRKVDSLRNMQLSKNGTTCNIHMYIFFMCATYIVWLSPDERNSAFSQAVHLRVSRACAGAKRIITPKGVKRRKEYDSLKKLYRVLIFTHRFSVHSSHLLLSLTYIYFLENSYLYSEI